MSIYEEVKGRYPEIELYTEKSGDWEDQGVESYKSKDYSKAVECFEMVIAAIPDHYNAYEMCSYGLYMSGRTQEALDYLREAIGIAKGFEGEAELPAEMIEDMERSLERMEKGLEPEEAYIEEIME